MLDKDSLWQKLSEQFRENTTDLTYDTWIKPVTPISFDGSTLTLSLPSELHRDYWKEQLAPNLIEYAFVITKGNIEPKFILDSDVKKEETELESEPTDDANEPEPDEEFSFSKETHLNPNYTFDNFIIGKGNQMAHAAALIVSEEPGKLYNPLFFYGGVGLGKTHLMQAIGNKRLEDHPETNVKYVTSEAFTNDFINAIQTNRTEEFRREYRNVDILMVDDIQFFAQKEGTQEEFFHTFNDLYNNDKQIVLTSDRVPQEIPKLQERLVSRFAWGLPVDITPPDLETRIAILKNKAKLDNLVIPNDTLAYIAGQIDSNVRELEGALSRVQAYSKLKNEPITTDLVYEALRGLKLTKTSRELSIVDIQNKVASYFHVSITDLKGKKRMKSIVVPRQIAMYLSREMTNNSLPKIGKEFGGKDHTTVIHACDKISEIIKIDIDIRKEIADIKSELN
ncbi:MAG: chromosomal replication initiator protein DnaA [Lentilactobacillus diolivorans]|uniref:Chromosomal replication initiator protein DnaA n=2 Tax=Lentilactobacillus diolivorans TaxID=179838 RepID=A0A0R1SJE1_9LACO|nr:chromosomal replication initiator protein DnaA [Lentilactobacillus diolivorans]KRL69526.1 chromosomal replication initiator protein DnaA [Lentilactobacillus diolivorans DSM 14421]MCH4163376.1 chromosomal replication initiator protein DnaA [Lentilactobacillus diolivorans]RRG03830.1 MAG: chromosomal replication initiator protein DnaA [Lactobacillus sp.]GEP23849.1 chromosomal replication initiator protein DnaA [Lentilactobacillus diolivorans]